MKTYKYRTGGNRLGRSILLVCLMGGGLGCTSQTPQTRPAEPDVGQTTPSDVYNQWLVGCLENLRKDLPQIAHSADEAAKLYVTGQYRLGAYGDKGFCKEINNRAGGLIQMEYAPDQRRTISYLNQLLTGARRTSSRPGASTRPANTHKPSRYPFKGIVLIALRDNRFKEDLAAAQSFQKQESKIVAICTQEQLDRAQAAGAKFDWVVLNHAAPNDGLFETPDGKYLVATSYVANIASAWVWTAEFVGACMRLGKMPTMHQSYAIAGSKDRAAKLKPFKFHDKTPPSVPPGELGGKYIDALKASLIALRRQETGRIQQGARLIAGTASTHHTVYLFVYNHVQLYRRAREHDLKCFTLLNEAWEVNSDYNVRGDELVLVMGYHKPLIGPDYKELGNLVLSRKPTVIWSLATLDKDVAAKIPPGQIVIDEKWQIPDAVVDVPGYELKIIPPSGVMSEAVLGMIGAELFALLPLD